MTPFTYHLYHKPTDTHYYGVRYAKDCDPSDLWTTYFSSSSVVHSLIEEHGVDSFDVRVRRTFETAEQAVLWETKVLRRLRASRSDKWLNRSNGTEGFCCTGHSEATKELMRQRITGKKRRPETKAKLAAKAKLREQKKREQGWTMPEDAKARGLETRKQRIETGEINPYSTKRNAKMAASKKGAKRVYRPDGSFYMSKGD